MNIFNCTVEELIGLLKTLDPESKIFIGEDDNLNGISLTTDSCDDEINILLATSK